MGVECGEFLFRKAHVRVPKVVLEDVSKILKYIKQKILCLKLDNVRFFENVKTMFFYLRSYFLLRIGGAK